ncbi:Photosystem I P700 chlorophyll a apoprotein A2 [Platanthera guangdongensis]|uniref:Photosystem I P700 chlorophyll a apoprotein A2 n=1 Tax=Platanthera guangdongensis TaxID=2320717 RepID=A0ABR2MW34_9ASPA
MERLRMGLMYSYLQRIARHSMQVEAYGYLELIETLARAHERTPLANLIQWKDKPVALSIAQARLVGLVHFFVGTEHYGKKRFDSKGEEAPEIGTEILLDSSILKKRNQQSSRVEGKMGNSWKIAIPTA